MGTEPEAEPAPWAEASKTVLLVCRPDVSGGGYPCAAGYKMPEEHSVYFFDILAVHGNQIFPVKIPQQVLLCIRDRFTGYDVFQDRTVILIKLFPDGPGQEFRFVHGTKKGPGRRTVRARCAGP